MGGFSIEMRVRGTSQERGISLFVSVISDGLRSFRYHRFGGSYARGGFRGHTSPASWCGDREFRPEFHYGAYARYEPLASILGVAADTVEMMNDEYNEASIRSIHAALFASIMENTLNKTFTRGIHDMIVILSEPEGYKAERALNAFASSFVPNVLNQTNGDELIRETRTLTDAFLARRLPHS
ncbi:MAG: hypothetical protein HRU32_14860 [Rhodobacteraceae bacterium]|nr:hypothetical protein [Paracoccaceae bacterium]